MGVLAGAMTPNQASYSNSGIPASAKVGTFGSVAIRLGAATANGCTFPDWIKSRAMLMPAKNIWESERMMPVSDSGAPL